MPAYFQIQWLPEDRIQDFCAWGGLYYVMADGQTTLLLTQPVWCRNCMRITQGELLGPASDWDQKIVELQNEIKDNLSRGFGNGDSGPEKRLANYINQRRLRMERKSPPRCIECGSADCVVFPQGQEVPSPKGHGRVVVRQVGMCDNGYRYWYYSQEGERMWDYKKPGELAPRKANWFERLKRIVSRRRGG
jgi:hypothetical protein